MKRILRSFLTLLMLVVWASGFAQEVTLDFTDNSVWQFPTQVAKTDVTKSNGAYNVTIEAGVYYNNSGKYLMLAKNKSLTLSAFDFDVDKIVVTTTTGSSKNAWSNIFVNNIAVSTKQVGNGTLEFVINDKFKSAGNIYTLTSLKNTDRKDYYNIQIKKIEIYKKASTKTLKSLAISGDATKKAYNDGEEFDPTGLVVTGTYDDASTAAITDGITWTKTPAKLAVGNTSCSVTATVNGVTSPAYEVTGLTVTKTISLSIEPAITTVVKAPVTVSLTATPGATVYYTTNGAEPSTSSTKYDAPFEVTKSGTIVKALAVADGAENVTAEATYTIKPDQPVFSDETKTFKDAFDVTLSLPESTDATSKIYYAIGAEATAKSSLYEGPINISAEKDGDKVILHAVVVDQYGNVGKEKFYTYTKTTAIVFDFTRNWDGVTPQNVNNNKTAANVLAGKELVVDGIVMTATNGKSLTTCLYGNENDHNLRVYDGGSITFTAPEGYNISEVTFKYDDKSAKFTATVGTYSNGTWTGNVHAVTFNTTASIKLKNATIKLVAIANTPLTLDENAETSVTDEALMNAVIAGNAYDVKLARTLTANVWNTICLPFDVTAEQIADVLKSAGNVKEFDREDASKQTIYFKDATTMVAGKPYLIKPTESAKELVFKGVKITEYEPKNTSGDNYAVYGTFGKYTMKTDGTELFLKTDGKFYIPAAGTATMKGFRAYFYNINGSTAGAALNLSFGDATGINGVAADSEKSVKVYNVNGQYVGTSLEALPKGLYIVGGKKVLK